MSIDGATQAVLASQQAVIADKISTAVQAKALDAARLQGDSVVQLIEAAANIGKSADTGKSFDAQG